MSRPILAPLRITLRAGRFTPAAKEQVATRILITPVSNALAIMSRSSVVNPASNKISGKFIMCFKQRLTMECNSIRHDFFNDMFHSCHQTSQISYGILSFLQNFRIKLFESWHGTTDEFSIHFTADSTAAKHQWSIARSCRFGRKSNDRIDNGIRILLVLWDINFSCRLDIHLCFGWGRRVQMCGCSVKWRRTCGIVDFIFVYEIFLYGYWPIECLIKSRVVEPCGEKFCILNIDAATLENGMWVWEREADSLY